MWTVAIVSETFPSATDLILSSFCSSMADLTALAGKIVAFEGLDGAGKSTVIGVLRKRLRAAGLTVFLPREGKDHSSRPTKMIRDLARDRVNIELRPRTEFALYCAREAQILDEQVRPAIARGEVVLLDRSILTAVVLGSHGRGLDRRECEAAARIVSGGLDPDITVILDVHPRTSRIRKRIGRARNPKPRDPSRKGLSGSGLKERVREGYREIAAERGHLLFHTERVDPQQLADRVVTALSNGARPSDLENPDDHVPRWQVSPDQDFDAALAALPLELAVFLTRGLIRGREYRRMAAAQDDTMLAAWALDPDDPQRESLAERAAAHVLSGWTLRPLDGPDDLRARLMDVAPGPVARSLRYLDDERSDRMRSTLAEHAPGEVVESLCGREDAFARDLRDRLWSQATVAQAATSLIGCRSDESWRRREELVEQDPAIAMRSLRGLADPQSHRVLERFADLAPKSVLRALTGDGSERGHELRRHLRGTGREVIDSLGVLDDEPSMTMREEHAERWPSTVLGSLTRVADDPRVLSLRQQCRRHGAGDLHVLRHIVARQEHELRPAWHRVHGSAIETRED